MDPTTLSARSVASLLVLVCLVPTTTHASAWTQPAGHLWWKVGASTSFADEKFANDQLDETKRFPDGSPVRAGDRIPFDFVTGGEYEFQRYALEAAYGVTDHLEVTATVPFLHTVFENDNDEVEPGTGFGDVVLGTAIGTRHGDRAAASLSLRWKIPTADVPRSVFAQPLGEGQHDLTVRAEAGWSLWPHGWLSATLGHRWRAANDELGFDPGNEWVLAAEWGWQLRPWLALVTRFDGLQGSPWTSRDFGIDQEIATRRLWSYAPALHIGLDRLGAPGTTLEVGASIALAGEDLPVSREFRIGLMSTLDLSRR
ncbi:MAG TPA: transporter [Candidatus Krumholzibacteria bacterium]|nr:transporter [Candidatus Krumholzibacteria bacterium]